MSNVKQLKIVEKLDDHVVKATGEWVIIQFDDDDEKSEGGIILVKPQEVSTKKAKVIDVGPDVQANFKNGDTVLAYAKIGIKFTHNGQDLHFMKKENILGVLVAN